MAQSLMLTADELKIFTALPEALRNGWKSASETLTTFETPAMLEMRAEISTFKNDKLKEMAALLQKGSVDLKALQAMDLTDDEIGEFFFTIGAQGTGLLVGVLLAEAKTDDDLQAVAHLTEMRHKLLELNSTHS